MEENKEMTIQEKSMHIWELEVKIAKLKDEQDKFKSEVEKELVGTNGSFNTYKDAFWEIHHRLGASTTKFDEAAFSKNEPDIYKELFAKYSKTSIGKDSWNWTKQKKIVKE